MQHNENKEEHESGGATGAAAAASTVVRSSASTAVTAPANTGSMFRYQKFKECPAKRPLTVCIDIPGVNVTHREVRLFESPALSIDETMKTVSSQTNHQLYRTCSYMSIYTLRNTLFLEIGILFQFR